MDNGIKMENLPLGLRHALEAGECVLFIGAGSYLKIIAIFYHFTFYKTDN